MSNDAVNHNGVIGAARLTTRETSAANDARNGRPDGLLITVVAMATRLH